MRQISFRSFILCVMLFAMSSVMLLAQNTCGGNMMSEKAQKYSSLIQRLEYSTSEKEGITQQEYDRYLATLYDGLAMEHYRHYQLEEAMSASQKSLPYFAAVNDSEGYIFASELLASVARHLRKYEIADEALSNALKLAAEEDYKDKIVQLLLQSYKLADERKDSRKIYEVLMDLKSADRMALNCNTRIDLILHDFNYAMDVCDTDLAKLHLEEYRRELELLPAELQPEHAYLYALNESRYLDKIGSYAEAAQCFERMLSSHSPSASDMQKYGQILYYSSYAGDEEKFDTYLAKINALTDSSEISPQVWMNVRMQMITSLLKLKRYDEALEILQQAEKSGVEDEWLYVYKGSVLHKLDRNEEAREAYRQYVEVCRASYGLESLKYASALRYLANIEGFCRDIESGEKHLIESFRLVQSIVRKELPFVSPDKLEGYWDQVSSGITAMAAYSMEAGIYKGELTEAAYEGLVLSKGLLLSSERSFSDYVARSGNEELQSLYGKTLELRERMEDLKKSYAQNKDEIQNLQPELSLMEASLSQYGSGLSEYMNHLDVTYDELQNSLKDNEVVIDFLDHESDKYGRKYIAFVYRRGWEAPVLVPICNQRDLDAFDVSGFRPDILYGRKYSSDLIKLVWKPLEKYVDKDDVVYLVPSGDMHLLSFDSFQLRGGALLGEKYGFVRLSSAKEILTGVSYCAEVKDAVLYGGLQYDMLEDDRVAAANKYKRSWRHLVPRGVRGSASDKFHDLPMSRKEVATVSELLNDMGVDTRCYMGLEGTEESFVGMGTPSPDIIHIATHGFYYTPAEASDVRGLAGYKDAMRLSGLVMSGGNAEWLGENIPENTLGGILTADDIAICDLSGTDLVVLTACDTGKGRITTEGVYGLQRAFKKAGARTVIMSLWKADDKAVADFISCFYTSLTSNGWNKREAFRSAKNQMHEKYRSPYYWAGFFMLD